MGKTGEEGLKMMESDKNGEKNAKQVPKFGPKTGNKLKNVQIGKKTDQTQNTQHNEIQRQVTWTLNT